MHTCVHMKPTGLACRDLGLRGPAWPRVLGLTPLGTHGSAPSGLRAHSSATAGDLHDRIGFAVWSIGSKSWLKTLGSHA